MRLLGNLIWLLLGGIIVSVLYFLYGLLLCITIIGIPFGIKIMQLGVLALMPFGKTVTINPVDGCLTTGFNILWVITGWWKLAAMHLIFGAILCITIIGIPLGKQHFKLMRYSFLPFGCEIK